MRLRLARRKTPNKAAGNRRAPVFILLKVYPGSLAADHEAVRPMEDKLSAIRYFLFYWVRASRIELLALWHSSRGNGSGL